MILVDNSIDVAAFIAKYVANKNQYINLTKLQKLMYCVYGAVLAFTGDHICKEHPKAWEHGPVFCKLYDYAKKHCELIETLLHHDEHVDSMISADQIKLIEMCQRSSQNIMQVLLLIGLAILMVRGALALKMARSAIKNCQTN